MGQGHDSKKKNAPPRPPPPKPSAQLKAVHNAVIFTEMLQKSHSSSQMASTPSSGPPQDLLISWDAPSPSTSPTPGRYSSDGLSLRSFGSDSSGIMANGGNLSHANSRSESGFESEPDAWSETTTSYAPPPVVAAAAAGKTRHQYGVNRLLNTRDGEIRVVGRDSLSESQLITPIHFLR